MRHRRFRLAVIAVAAVGLSANAASATTRADAGPSAQVCKEGYFCLWEGEYQTGRLLFAEDAHVTDEGFQFPDRDDIEPPIHPLSARNPVPDDFGCVIRLNNQPKFAGEEQELAGSGDHELDGHRVASITTDCG